MSLSVADLDAIRQVVREELNAVPVPEPVAPAVAAPLAFWTRPKDLRYAGDTHSVQDVTEARYRALYGVRWDGTHALTGAALEAAWGEVEAIKSLTPETVKVYRRGSTEVLDPDLAAFAILTGTIVWQTEPLRPAHSNDFAQFAGLTVDSFLDREWNGITGGPSGQ